MEIALIGAGGHSEVIKEMIHASKDARLAAVLDDKYPELQFKNNMYKGPISSAKILLGEKRQLKFIVAIGDNELRKSVVARLSLDNDQYVSLIHETAFMSPSAAVGQGTVVMAKAVVQASAKIGNHVIINTGAVVEHDVILGDYVHAAPNAALTGAVQAAEGAMIGAGAAVIPGKTIGEWASIGAGAAVISDIPAHSTAVGTPAKVVNHRQRTAADMPS